MGRILLISLCVTLALSGFGIGQHANQARELWAWEGYGEFIYDGVVLERRRVEMFGGINCHASAWAFRERFKRKMPKCRHIGDAPW